MKISILPAASTDNASARLRAFDLCNALVAVGQEAAIEVMADADVLVVQKAINDDILHYAKLIKDRGGVVIYDLDESSATVLDRLHISADQWQDMVALADVVTTDTPARRDLLLQTFPNARVQVLPNGIDYLPAASPLPVRQEGERLQVLWFGYVDNLHQIAPYMDVLNAMELDLHVATDAQATAELESLLPGANIIPWDLATFPDRLRKCDLSLLLQQGDEHVRAGSNQKMLACIANGVVPIVSDSREYSALAGEIGAGDSIFSTPEEMATTIGRYASLQARTAYLEKARPLVLKRYAPEAVAQIFLDIVTSASPNQAGHLQAAPESRGSVQTAGSASAAKAGDEPPLFTVIVTTYNRPRLLVDALRSVDTQTCRDFEIILVNDCGEPVEHLLNQFGSVIHLVRQGRNRGPGAARNTGLTLARGKYVVYLDDDDLMMPNHLEVLARELAAHPDTVVYTDPEYVGETIEGHRRIERERSNPCAHGDFSAETLAIQNFIPINTFCHSLAITRQIGKWDESLTALEDWEFLLRLAKVMPFFHVRQMTVQVRVLLDSSGNNISARSRRKFPELFRKIYAKNPTDNPAIQAGRKRMLAMFDAERKTWEAETGDKETQEKKPKETAAEKQLRFYRSWIERHTLQEVDVHLMAERMLKKWTRRPQFLVLALFPRSSGAIRLHRTLQSMQSQLYQDWRLIVVADAPSPDPVFEQTDTLGWLHLDSLEDDATVFTAINQVIAAIPSDWVAVLPAGAEFDPNWMITTADYVNLHPEWAAIYTDDDFLDEEGLRGSQRLKPEFNLDYLRSMDYVGSSCWFRTDHIQELGGFGAFPGALHYEFLLRLFDACGHQVIGHIAEPLVHYPESLPPHPLADAAIQVALEAHFQRTGIDAAIEPGYAPGTRHIVYQHDTQPLVSILIPNRDSYGYLKPCVESIFAKTDYPAFEVIVVDNQTADPDVLAFYAEASDRYAGRFRVVPYDKPFNFSAQCNLGVEKSEGEYILLLNNDTEMVQPAWLSRMMQFGQRPDVGIVGARLVYPENGGLQHAGIVLGLGPVAAHPCQGTALEEAGYMNRLHVDQNYSAVTAACLLVRRSVYQQVGGMDEENLEILFNDLDLCLKTGEAGYRIVWTPHATVVHLEHKSLEVEQKNPQIYQSMALRNQKADAYMHSRWPQMLANDPAYNRHLTLSGGDFIVDPVLVADWDVNFHDRPRVLAFPPPGGIGEYRFYAPLRGLAMEARIQTTVVQTAKYHEIRHPSLTEVNRLAPDTLMRQVTLEALDLVWLNRYREHRPDILYLFMMDDLISDLPKDHPNYRNNPRDARYRLRQLLAQADRLIVSTEPLRDFAKDMISDVRVLPNRLRDELWLPLSSQRRTSKRPRIGWAGAQQHKGDLALIVDVVKETAEEADWIFFGMCPDELRPYVREYHEFELGVEAYPAKLASLNLDLAVAPLEQHAFNEAKSNLRLLEYGVLGLPVICTDILPYQTDDAPVKRVANNSKAWLEAIRDRIHDLDATAREGDTLKEWVLNNHLLSQHLDAWYEALTERRR